MAPKDYDLFQQVYTQSFGANISGSAIGTECILQEGFNYALKTLFATQLEPYGWELVWGPRVWKENPECTNDGVDNAWFVSFAPNVVHPDGVTIDTYVVAIAGTSPTSSHDTVENFGVDSVVDFREWVSKWRKGSVPEPQKIKKPTNTGPYLAFGTSDGVYRILSNRAPKDYPGAETTIVDFLSHVSSDCRIIFTGHSLGGALAPAVALGLKSVGLLNQLTNPFENVIVLPSAGVSPGELVFSQAYGKLFAPAGPQRGYQTWNADFFNTRDVVPQAWCTDNSASPERNMNNILTIYGDLPDKLAARIKRDIEMAIKWADLSGVTYIPIHGSNFSGEKLSNPPKNIDAFQDEMLKQHITAYYEELQLGESMASFYRDFVGYDGVKKKPREQVLQSFPIFQALHEEQMPDEVMQGTFPYDAVFEVSEPNPESNNRQAVLGGES